MAYNTQTGVQPLDFNRIIIKYLDDIIKNTNKETTNIDPLIHKTNKKNLKN